MEICFLDLKMFERSSSDLDEAFVGIGKKSLPTVICPLVINAVGAGF